jgi:hypothetical protein
MPIVSSTAPELDGAIGGATTIQAEPLFRVSNSKHACLASKPCQTRLKRAKRANLSMYG